MCSGPNSGSVGGQTASRGRTSQERGAHVARETRAGRAVATGEAGARGPETGVACHGEIMAGGRASNADGTDAGMEHYQR